MAVIHFGVDMRTIGVGGGGYALPLSPANGWLCEIVKFENSTTKDGNNGKLDVHLRIVEPGEHFGATGIWSLNLFHSNPDSRRISLEQLKSLFVICGHQVALSADPDILVGRQVRVVVGPHKYTKDGKEINTTQCKRALTLVGAVAASVLDKAVPLTAPGAEAPVFGAPAPQVAPQAPPQPAQVAPVAPTQGGFQPAPGSVPGWAL